MIDGESENFLVKFVFYFIWSHDTFPSLSEMWAILVDFSSQFHRIHTNNSCACSCECVFLPRLFIAWCFLFRFCLLVWNYFGKIKAKRVYVWVDVL